MASDNSATMQTCPACGTAIDTADVEPLARIECPKCGEKVRVERKFDNFVLVETLGIGGMGTVYYKERRRRPRKNKSNRSHRNLRRKSRSG